MLRSIGLKPGDAPNIADAKAILKDFAQKFFAKEYNAHARENKRYGFLLEYIDNRKINGIFVKAFTDPKMNFTDVGSITFTKLAFSTFRQLLTTMGHEFQHARDYWSGDYNKWRGESQGNDFYLENMAELSARSWEIRSYGQTATGLYLKLQFGGSNSNIYFNK